MKGGHFPDKADDLQTKRIESKEVRLTNSEQKTGQRERKRIGSREVRLTREKTGHGGTSRRMNACVGA